MFGGHRGCKCCVGEVGIVSVGWLREIARVGWVYILRKWIVWLGLILKIPWNLHSLLWSIPILHVVLPR